MRLLTAGCSAEIGPDSLVATLALDGVVLLRQADVHDVRTLLGWWAEPVSHPHQAAEGLTVIAPGEVPTRSTGNEAGFTSRGLPPHTDRSGHSQAPSLLATVMVSPAPPGGRALLVDGAAVLANLRRQFDEPAIAGLRLRTQDGGLATSVFEFDGDLIRIRYRDDPVARPANAAGREDVVARLRRLIVAATTSRPLRAGDGYILHNHRFLHGRTGFTGGRRLVRLLAKVKDSHPYAWLNRGFSSAGSESTGSGGERSRPCAARCRVVEGSTTG